MGTWINTRSIILETDPTGVVTPEGGEGSALEVEKRSFFPDHQDLHACRVSILTQDLPRALSLLLREEGPEHSGNSLVLFVDPLFVGV